MSPVPLEIVLSRLTPQELCEALVLLRRYATSGTFDRAEAERLMRRILESPTFRGRWNRVKAR